MQQNRQFAGALLALTACVGSFLVVAAGVQQAPRISRGVEHGVGVAERRGFPGSVELLHRSQDDYNDIRRRDRSNSNFNGISAGISNQNYVGDNRNNIHYYRRSRVNAEFANAVPPPPQPQQPLPAGAEAAQLVPISVATTATKTLQQLHGDDNHNHDGNSASSSSSSVDLGQVDKRKLLLSNLHLFNGTDTKNLTDSQKMLLIQIADRVARYGENNLFRELVNAQQQQQQRSDSEGLGQDEGRANTKPDSATSTTKKAKPSKRPHAATLSSAAPSKATTTTTTTKRQPVPAGDAVSATPTKTTTKSKVRPNTSFTPSPAASSVTPAMISSSQSLSTPSDAATTAEKRSTTVATSRHTKKPPGSVEDIIYDYNVTASALIESLSQPNPTSNSLLYQQTMHPAANGGSNVGTKQSSTGEPNKVRIASVSLN